MDLQVQDLFTAGIGFDLGGAYLLARGLINPPSELVRLAGSFWGSNRFQAINVAKSRLDAIAGVAGLFAGFILQAVGYVASLSASHVTRTGVEEAAAGALLALLTLAVMLSAGAAYRRFRLIPLLVEMGRWTLDDERREYPSASLLPGWIEALGHDRQDGEDDLAFVRRVAHIENLVVNVNPRPGTSETRWRLWTEPPLEGETR